MIKILFLSDERDGALISEFLPEATHRIEWASAYDDAKVAFEREEYDVYLVDALFHGGRGVHLAQSAARRGGRPVIVVTRRTDAAFEAKLLGRGIADVLLRTDLTPAELDRSIRHAVARSTRERRLHYADIAAKTVGLPALEGRLQNAVERARRGLGGVALIAVRVDPDPAAERTDPGMVALLQGDALERVRSCLRDLDTISRAQGTLYALLEERDAHHAAAHVADRILGEMSMPFSVRGKAVKMSASVGMSLFPDDGDDAEALMKSVQEALDAAIAAGGNVFRLPTSPATGRAARRIVLERLLERAVERQEFSIVYQPQVDMRSGEVVGAEALLRWSDPELGSVPPSEFVPMLENADLIEEVGEWVLRRACAQASAWAQAGTALKVSVNVSARQFALGDVLGVVQGALAETDLPAHLLTLELTEGVMLDSTPEIRATLSELRRLGVRIAIDDFGTGYASLRYVKHFPMDVVKIDKEFVRGLPLNTANAAITNSIAALAHSLGLGIVAEGVETEAEAEFLRDLRCYVVQGYLHGRPMAASPFADWRAAR